MPSPDSGAGATAGSLVSLSALGWDPRVDALFASHGARGLLAGRVVRVDRGGSLVATASGERRASLGPGLLAHSADAEAHPVTGDWVALSQPPGASAAVIAAVLPRASAFRRFHDGIVQVLAANVDVVFIVIAAGVGANATSGSHHRLAIRPDGRVRRLDRELALALGSGARPVIVISKADLAVDIDSAIATVANEAPGIPIHATSGASGEGVATLLEYAAGNRTLALIGASGVGKSTIANRLLGHEALATSQVRSADGRGRHTTTARHLLPLPGGGVLIDTPGIRTLGLWDAEAAVGQVYADVEQIAALCRFNDCVHEQEPGCAVRAAIANGELTDTRLASYRKLRREAALEERRRDPRREAEERQRLRASGRGTRRREQERGKSRWRDEG